MSQQRARGSRPSMPMSSSGTAGAVVAVVALVLGFLILRDVRSDGGSTVTEGTPTPTAATGDTVPAGATTTTPPLNRGGFTIQVANASGIAGSAGDLTTKLQAQNFVVKAALNVSPGTAKREKTGVFYATGCESNAQLVASVLGGNVELDVMPSPIPLETGSLGDACVLILLGTDLSFKPLSNGTPYGGVGTTTTVPPAG